MLRWVRFAAALALALRCVQATAQGPARLVAREDNTLALTPDLELAVDGGYLRVRSESSQLLLALPYGSSRTGFADVVAHATLSPSGDAAIYYRNWCRDSLLRQVSSTRALRARLLVEEASSLPAPRAGVLVERAFALAPREPPVAVAQAALRASDPARATQVLRPALLAARLETYFEVLRTAAGLRSLPLLRRQRAAVAGNARLSFEQSLFAVSGSLAALDVAAATEADCPSVAELVVLDLQTGSVVFRRPFALFDASCRVLPVDVGALDLLLGDLGFNRTGEAALADSTDFKRYSFAFPSAGLSLLVDLERHTLQLRRGERLLRSSYWASADAPRRARFVAARRSIVVETNRDSDVCEGLPALELVRVP